MIWAMIWRIATINIVYYLVINTCSSQVIWFWFAMDLSSLLNIVAILCRCWYNDITAIINRSTTLIVMRSVDEVIPTALNWKSVENFGQLIWLAIYISCQIREITSCACTGNAGNVFPRHCGLAIPTCITCVTRVPWCMPGSLTSGFLWSRWRGKRSRQSRCMRNTRFCVSGKRPMERGVTTFIDTVKM